VTFSKSRAIYEIMLDNMMEPERTQIIWRLRVAYWISKPTRSREHTCVCAPTPSLSLTHTHTHRRTHTHAFIHARTHAELFSTRWFKYDRDKLWLVYTQIVPVIFEPPCTYCFPRQQWFRERASTFRYTYITSVVNHAFISFDKWYRKVNKLWSEENCVFINYVF
jgi:hypothetical protein